MSICDLHIRLAFRFDRKNRKQHSLKKMWSEKESGNLPWYYKYYLNFLYLLDNQIFLYEIGFTRRVEMVNLHNLQTCFSCVQHNPQTATQKINPLPTWLCHWFEIETISITTIIMIISLGLAAILGNDISPPLSGGGVGGGLSHWQTRGRDLHVKPHKHNTLGSWADFSVNHFYSW